MRVQSRGVGVGVDKAGKGGHGIERRGSGAATQVDRRRGAARIISRWKVPEEDVSALRLGPVGGIFEVTGGDGDVAGVGGDAFGGFADGGLDGSVRGSFRFQGGVYLFVGDLSAVEDGGGNSLIGLGRRNEDLRSGQRG